MPDITDCAWLWRAFQEIATCRGYVETVPGPIPITAIWAYIDRYALPEWTVDALISIDAAWRISESDRASRAIAGQPAGRPRRGARPRGE